MRILVCGGNGFIGRHIVNLLALAGHDPVARSRHSLPALDYAKATTPEAWLPHLAGVDAVVNAVGVLRDSASRPIDAMHAQAPIALFDACAAAGVRRVVQISALGIEGSATRYATTKRAADEHLLALTAAGHLQGCVVRPSVVFGAGGASSEMFLSMARLPALLLPRPVLQARVDGPRSSPRGHPARLAHPRQRTRWRLGQRLTLVQRDTGHAGQRQRHRSGGIARPAGPARHCARPAAGHAAPWVNTACARCPLHSAPCT